MCNWKKKPFSEALLVGIETQSNFEQQQQQQAKKHTQNTVRIEQRINSISRLSFNASALSIYSWPIMKSFCMLFTRWLSFLFPSLSLHVAIMQVDDNKQRPRTTIVRCHRFCASFMDQIFCLFMSAFLPKYYLFDLVFFPLSPFFSPTLSTFDFSGEGCNNNNEKEKTTTTI